MDKRPETRVATVILVRAWGMDADGRPFFQNANATNLSSEGARILGISHPLKSGDVIGVQHEEKKARFKVIWVIDSGVARQIEAGVQILPNQQVPWQALTKNDKVDVAPAKNKRKYVRHKVLFPLEIGFEDSRRENFQEIGLGTGLIEVLDGLLIDQRLIDGAANEQYQQRRCDADPE